MTKEEFAAKLKKQNFRKVTSANGAKGYTTDMPTATGSYGLTCYAAPDMTGKKALDFAWAQMLRRLAKEWGYNGDLTAFR